MAAENDLIQGRYQLNRLVGGGAMGDVFAGTDTVTGEPVAVKQLRGECSSGMPQMVERFLREGEVLRRLNHPNIVKVLATVDEGRQHYIIMEWVGGGSLADLLARESKLPFERVVSIGLELSDALSRAHHLEILHRDIKPANILLAEDGTPRLTDFGLALVGEQPRLTESGSILGTLYYLAPEVYAGRAVNERADIWSFGVVLFEMLTGRLPFDGETAFDLMWAIKTQPLPVIENLRPGIPAALAHLVRRMLRKDAPARIESARQVGVELEAIQKQIKSQTGRGGLSTAEAAPTPIRVLIADDHAVVRQGLRMFIDLQEDMQVIGEGTNGSEAVELAGRLKPDIVLLDLVMPQLDGVEATARIKSLCPDTRVVILTSFGENDKVFPAIRAGAQGYLLKDIRPEDLVRAVREACQGKIQLAPEIARKLMESVAESAVEKPEKTGGDA
ncbi:MAG TPA: protein kinase [Anaerolineaceae bacterium]